MLTLFHEHYKVQYVPRSLSALFFYAVCLLIILVAPVFIGLGMGNFWSKNNYLMQMPRVRFTDRCVLRFTTVRGQEKLWTCSDAFNMKFIDGQESLAVLPFFAIYEDDHDGDGRVDSITMILSLPVNDVNVAGGVVDHKGEGETTTASNMDGIYRVDFLPEFFYDFHGYIIKLSMTAATLFSFEMGKWVSGVEKNPLAAITEGDLLFHSTEPLESSPYVHYTQVYTGSPFDNITDIDELLNVPLFASRYTSRNQSVVFRPYTESVGGLGLLQNSNYNRVLGEDLGALGDFTWCIKLRVQHAEVKYVPSIQEALKWAWVQYFCIACILQWLLWWLRGFVVKSGLISTTAFFYSNWKFPS